MTGCVLYRLTATKVTSLKEPGRYADREGFICSSMRAGGGSSAISGAASVEKSAREARAPSRWRKLASRLPNAGP